MQTWIHELGLYFYKELICCFCHVSVLMRFINILVWISWSTAMECYYRCNAWLIFCFHSPPSILLLPRGWGILVFQRKICYVSFRKVTIMSTLHNHCSKPLTPHNIKISNSEVGKVFFLRKIINSTMNFNTSKAFFVVVFQVFLRIYLDRYYGI